MFMPFGSRKFLVGKQVVTINQQQTNMLFAWLLNFHNGKQDPIYKLAMSIIANAPLDGKLTMEAIDALEVQHMHFQRIGKENWMGSRQLVIANLLAGLLMGVDSREVFGKTMEFISANEYRMS